MNRKNDSKLVFLIITGGKKKMKKVLKGLLFALVGVFTVVLVASCGHEHKAKEKWERDSSTHWHECEGCDEMLDSAVHEYGEWVVDSQPDHENSVNGARHRDCKVCGFRMKEAIQAMPVFYVRGTVNGWGDATDQWKLTINGTTESITGITFVVGDEWKIATADWKNEANAGNLDEAAKEYFEGTGNIVVKVAGTYTITVTDALGAKTISVVKTA